MEKIAQSYATALADCGKFMLALESFNRALSLAPGLDSTHQLLGYALLGPGCFAEGWSEYIYGPGLTCFEVNIQTESDAKAADGLTRKHVVVIREQGLGDEIFFYGSAATACSRCTGHLLCEPKIHTLLAAHHASIPWLLKSNRPPMRMKSFSSRPAACIKRNGIERAPA